MSSAEAPKRYTPLSDTDPVTQWLRVILMRLEAQIARLCLGHDWQTHVLALSLTTPTLGDRYKVQVGTVPITALQRDAGMTPVAEEALRNRQSGGTTVFIQTREGYIATHAVWPTNKTPIGDA